MIVFLFAKLRGLRVSSPSDKHPFSFCQSLLQIRRFRHTLPTPRFSATKTKKCSFLPEEREWLKTLTSWGLHDTFREKYPTTDDVYSWFDYRSKGFDREPKRGLRIDVILATTPLNDLCLDAGVDYDVRSMEKPSDHCPIWTEFNI